MASEQANAVIARLGEGGRRRTTPRARVIAAALRRAQPFTAQELVRELARHGVELVPLASPTTTDKRLSRIGRASGTAVYYVSREGVTGVRKGLAPNLAQRIAHVKKMTGKPLMVGFGVAEPAQAKALAPYADGVVVGSALVLAGAKGGAGGVSRLAKRLVSALEI